MQQSCAEIKSVNSGGGNRNGIYRAFLVLQLQEPSATVNHIHTLLYSINITHFVYLTSLANLEPPINLKKGFILTVGGSWKTHRETCTGPEETCKLHKGNSTG